MKKIGFTIIALILSGCAATLQTDTRSMVLESSGKKVDGVLMAEKNRVGTELQWIGLFDEKGNLVAQAAGSGRGIGAGITDGALSAALHAGGLIGAATLLRPDEQTYSGGNSGAGGGSAFSHGGDAYSAAKGGDAMANANQLQIQKASANATARARANSSAKSWSKSSGKGWVPPGQNAK